MDLEVEHLDVKIAFLHGDLQGKSTWSSGKDLRKRTRRSLCAG